MPTQTATTSGTELELPQSLHDALGKPRRLRVVRQADGGAAVIAIGIIDLLKDRLRPFLGGPGHHHARLIGQTGETARFRMNVDLGRAQYGVTNHHPHYFLMLIDQPDDARSREQTWREIDAYHEHREATAQDENANRVSRWLVEEVLAPLGGASYLEVGCGAGRNLVWLHAALPDAELKGLDVNPRAIDTARAQLPDASLQTGSIYDLGEFPDRSVDVVFSVGVIEHIPHERAAEVVTAMWRIARVALVQFEAHGPSHDWDYHRYPRHYDTLYEELDIPVDHYEPFPRSDYRSSASSHQYALITARRRS